MRRLMYVWLFAILVFACLTLAACNQNPNNLTVPSNVAGDCSHDVTVQLQALLENTPAGGTVNLAAGACYLVTSLPVANLTNVTIWGHGAIIRQSSYNGGNCSTDVTQPIVHATGNTNLHVHNVTLQGPAQCGGAGTEGGYGILIGGTQNGNSGLSLDNVHVSYTAGDAVAILPQLGTGYGINTNVSITNSTFDHIGYHVLTLEGVNGLNYTGNAISNSGNFADLEVDANCPDCGTGTPTSVAQSNVTISGNTFTSAASQSDWITAFQGSCIPQTNVTITNNTLDSTVNPAIQLGGGESPACHDSSLTISGNTATYPTRSPCGGPPNQPPACAIYEVADYDNVTIANNTLTAYDGESGYLPNSLYVPCVALAGVNTAAVTGNTCNNTYTGVYSDGNGIQFLPADPAVTGLTECGNTWGLTQPVNGAAAAPATDGACP